ncbi:hypothetical protein APSETT445_006582 [Aspergillus pseudonomiae]
MAESEPKRPNETVDELPPLTAVEEKAILRRIDLCLLPLMFVSYLLQYLDKTAMSYTSILGLLPGTVRCRYVFFDTIQAVVSDFNIAHEHRAWVFIIFGIITLVWSIFQFFALPDSPLNAKFLSPSQRGPAYRRAQACQQTYQSREWKKDQFIEALIDPKTWFLFTYNFLVSLPNGGITNFSSLVIASFGFDTFNTLLYTIPMAAVALVFLLLSAFTCNRFRGLRCYWMIITLLISLIGILLMRQLPVEKKWGRLVGVWLVTVFGAGFPLSLSLVSSNFAGFTKKTTVTAVLFIGYCVGNIAGPQLFKKNQAPHYYSAFAAILACFCIAVLDVALLRAYMVWENKRRDRKQGRVIEPETKEAEDSEGSTARRQVGDVSDWQNQSFRFCL